MIKMNPYFLIVPFCFIAGLAITMFLPSFNLTAFIQSIPSKIQAGMTQLQTYGVSPTQLVGALGGVATISTIIIGKLRSKLNQTKKEAAAQLYQTQASATQQEHSLLSQIENQNVQMQNKDIEIQQLKQQIAATPDSAQLQANYQQLQNDYNVMEQTYQKLVNDLKQQEKVVIS